MVQSKYFESDELFRSYKNKFFIYSNEDGIERIPSDDPLITYQTIQPVQDVFNYGFFLPSPL